MVVGPTAIAATASEALVEGRSRLRTPKIDSRPPAKKAALRNLTAIWKLSPKKKTIRNVIRYK